MKERNRDAKFAEIMRLRQEIQHAADGVWPWYSPDSAAKRVLYKLPAGRPYTA